LYYNFGELIRSSTLIKFESGYASSNLSLKERKYQRKTWVFRWRVKRGCKSWAGSCAST